MHKFSSAREEHPKAAENRSVELYSPVLYYYGPL